MARETTAAGVRLSRRSTLTGLAAMAIFAAPSLARGARRRIVTIGSGVTETVFALGLGSDVVATDATSLFPHAAAALPKLNYPKALSAEEVLARRPDIVLVADEAGPRAALDAVAGSGAHFLRLAEAQAMGDIAAGVRLIAETVGERAAGEALAQALETDFAVIEAGLAGVSSRRRALALLGAPDAYRLIAAGRGSPAAIALGFAGAENAAEGIAGWSWIAPTLVRDLDPETIVSICGSETYSRERVLASAGVRDSAAGRDGRVALIDELTFTGFGPRSARAIHAVAAQIYPEAGFAPPPSRRWAEVGGAAL